MTLIEILNIAKDEDKRIVFGRESDKWSDYALKQNELCLCFNGVDGYYDEPGRPEYSGFENLSLEDVLANDWIAKGNWKEEEW